MFSFRSFRIPFREAQNKIAPRLSSDSGKLERQFSSSYSSNSCCKSSRGTGDKVNSLLLTPAPQSIFLQKARTICGRENCKDPCDFPPCAPEKFKSKVESERKLGENFYEVYWNKPECCNKTECADFLPRFDDLYYQESDKENRIYTQTWVDCPPMVIAPKPICCTMKASYPPLCKRPRKERPKTACANEACPPELEGKCPKIKMPCCRPARTGRCVKGQVANKCVKFKAPMPAFSECSKPKPKVRRASECTCLTAFAACEMYNIKSNASQKNRNC